jgi:hypothetical protein
VTVPECYLHYYGRQVTEREVIAQISCGDRQLGAFMMVLIVSLLVYYYLKVKK